MDHGAIPAGTTVIMEDLNLNYVQLGVVGSLVFLGLSLGAVSASLLFTFYSSKWIVLISLGCCNLFLYLFVYAENYLMLSILRMGCGFFQVNICVYFLDLCYDLLSSMG
jgi:predicted MFS family arabinose efflux permease